MVRVLDNGPGIAPRCRRTCLKKYRAGLNGPHGAGLGLYLSMGLARKMGGSLCAQNVSGAGAAFTFSFPIQTAKKAALASEAGPTPGTCPAWAVEFSASPAGGRAGSGHPSFHFQRPVRHGRAARAARLFL